MQSVKTTGFPARRPAQTVNNQAEISSRFSFHLAFTTEPPLMIGNDRILVTTGRTEDLSKASTEIVHLSSNLVNDDAIGIKPPSDTIPDNVEHAVGGIFSDGTTVICGGRTIVSSLADYPEVKDNCLALGWQKPFVRMNRKRWKSSSIMWNDNNGKEVLWITGGASDFSIEDPDFYSLRSTEMVTFSGSTEFGPDLPGPLEQHCLVRLNDTTALLTGGYIWTSNWALSDESLKETHYFSLNATWTDGPKLLETRQNHACGVLLDQESLQMVVIVAGGFSLDTTECLQVAYQQQSQWIPGEKLPFWLSGATGISTLDNMYLVLVGGVNQYSNENNRNIFSFSCTNSYCTWNIMEQQLQQPRGSAVAMSLPAEVKFCS